MNIKEVVKELRKYPDNMDVYFQKQDPLKIFGCVFNVSLTTHPIFNYPCILLHDGDEELKLPYHGISRAKSRATIGTLIIYLESLARFIGDEIDVMTKPIENKNFVTISEIESYSYTFFGKEIPCILLIE